MPSLEQEIRKHCGKEKLPKHVASRIRSKYEHLKKLYGISYDPTVLSLIDSPSLFEQASGIPSLDLFFRRHIDIWLSECGQNDLVDSSSKCTTS